jgi:uncharacterized membrane protein
MLTTKFLAVIAVSIGTFLGRYKACVSQKLEDERIEKEKEIRTRIDIVAKSIETEIERDNLQNEINNLKNIRC